MSIFILMLIVQSTLTTFLSISHLDNPFHSQPIVWTMLAGWLTVLIASTIVALAAMLTIARDAASTQYQLLALTNISAGRRVDGYVTGVLYRMRFFLMLLAVIMPWLASGMAVARLADPPIGYYRVIPLSDPILQWEVTVDMSPGSAVLEAILVHLMLWGLILLAAYAGVMFGLKWRHNPAVVFLFAVCVLLIDGAAIYGWTLEEQGWGSNPVMLNPGMVGIQPLQVGICAGIFALTFGINRLAQRWA